MHNFNMYDITIIAILFLSIIAGLMRGLIKEVIALITWIAAFALSILYCSRLALIFAGTPPVSSAVSKVGAAGGAEPVSMLAIGISFLVIFVTVLLVGMIVNYLINSVANRGALGFGNRLLGAIFGFLRGVFIVLVYLFVAELSPMSQQPAFEESRMVAIYQPMVDRLNDYLQPRLEELKSNIENSESYLPKLTKQKHPQNESE